MPFAYNANSIWVKFKKKKKESVIRMKPLQHTVRGFQSLKMKVMKIRT